GAQTVRKEAAFQQRRETAFLDLISKPETRAQTHVWTLSEFLQHPSEVLRTLVEDSSPAGAAPLTTAPVMHDLSGLSQFLQDLKNQGLQLHTAGEVSEGAGVGGVAPVRRILR
ncbi:MAG: glycosyl transferase, partial [Pseudomonadota bacterium]